MGKYRILKKVSFVLGFMLCSFPLVSGVIQQHYLSNVVDSYKKMIEESSSSSFSEELERANNYNEVLYESISSVVSEDKMSLLAENNYNEILNINDGLMGSIEIPKININLPIYHGTSDEVLSSGVGHVVGSSLPVGGVNTKSILTGHRGLPSSKLFTRLDELELGDLFYISVLGETLAYKVVDISVIEPEDVSNLKIEEGKDLVSLITCTPYGINTHRLVVTGNRIEYSKEVYKNIDKDNFSVVDIVFIIIPTTFIVILLVKIIKNRKENNNEVKEN